MYKIASWGCGWYRGMKEEISGDVVDDIEETRKTC